MRSFRFLLFGRISRSSGSGFRLGDCARHIAISNLQVEEISSKVYGIANLIADDNLDDRVIAVGGSRDGIRQDCMLHVCRWRACKCLVRGRSVHYFFNFGTNPKNAFPRDHGALGKACIIVNLYTCQST